MCKPFSGPLPAILKRRFNLGSSAEDRRAVFQALVEHYWQKHHETPREKMDPSRENAAATISWQALAEALMFDFIPAFQPKLSKTNSHILRDWMNAGGSISTFMADFDRYYRHFYQAQLVWLIQEQVRQKDRSRAWVFRWFANEVETQGPKEKERRTSLLPRPYRKRFTEKSLKQAFNAIPRSVRERPCDYLPVLGLGAAARLI
jgi:hypothetical protein